MSDAFDPTPYTRAPLLNVASAVTLGTALLVAMPKKPEPRLAKAGKRLRAAVVSLQQAWVESDAATAHGDPRPADQAIDNSYANLFARLQAYASLDPEVHPKATRAAELISILFPTGLTFLKLPYVEEWAESKKRLDRIESDDLAKDLDALAGKEFLGEVRRLHERYGEALGVTKVRGPAEAASIGEPLRKVAEAVVHYATQIAGLYDPDEPSTLDIVRTALAPIDELRVGVARRSAAGSEGSATLPVPPVPVGPATPAPAGGSASPGH